MKALITTLFVCFLSGCVAGTVELTTTLEDGSSEDCRATYTSFFRDTTEAAVSGCGAYGKSATSNTSELSQLITLLNTLLAAK